jgi:mannitol-1-phosphate 5-dehydrogenase
MKDRTIVIWGAGRIGRGFVADLFQAAGYRIVFVDESVDLVEQLRRAGQYTVAHVPGTGQREDVTIAGYTALATGELDRVAAEVAAADLAAVAVYPDRFQAVAGDLAHCLLWRWNERPDAALDILLCTNLMHPGPQFRQALEQAVGAEGRGYLQSHLGIVEALVIRMAPDAPEALRRVDPLMVWTNGYPELPVDGRGFKGALPAVPALRLVADMRAEEMRKMYTYNMAHAVLAYQGARRGHHLIVDCLADPGVRCEAEGALDEASRALQAEYGFSTADMAAWTQGVLRQTNNPALGDAVERYAADSERKLGHDDRLLGPTLLALQHDIRPRHIIAAIAAALRYADPGDAGVTRVQSRIVSLGLEGAIREICGLTDADVGLVHAIVKAYGRQLAEEEWDQRARRAYQLGFEYEREYHGCGQCTLAAVLESLGLYNETAFEAATPLSGGLGLAGDASCAALTAAALAIGMVFPRRRAHFDADRENKYRAFAMVQQLREKYRQAYDSILCHDIQRHQMGRAFDLRSGAEREAFEAAGAHDDACTSVVALAAKWAVELIGAESMRDSLEGD